MGREGLMTALSCQLSAIGCQPTAIGLWASATTGSPKGGTIVAQDVSPGSASLISGMLEPPSAVDTVSEGSVPTGLEAFSLAVFPALTCWATIVSPFGLRRETH